MWICRNFAVNDNSATGVFSNLWISKMVTVEIQNHYFKDGSDPIHSVEHKLFGVHRVLVECFGASYSHASNLLSPPHRKCVHHMIFRIVVFDVIVVLCFLFGGQVSPWNSDSSLSA